MMKASSVLNDIVVLLAALHKKFNCNCELQFVRLGMRWQAASPQLFLAT